jgi:putative transcriptional regulator
MSGVADAAIRHHPSAATLMGHAAGTLWEAAKPVVAVHLAHCSECRGRFAQAEAVGGLLLEGLPPAPLTPGALERALKRLNADPQPVEAGVEDVVPMAGTPAGGGVEDSLAATLRSLGLPTHRLRWVAPGIRHALLLRSGPEAGGGTLRLLRVRPGAVIPRHAHCGAELTLVLEGAFADETGRYGPGDVAEVEAEVSHRPVAQGPSDCVCLVAAQGFPRFSRMLSGLFGTHARK